MVKNLRGTDPKKVQSGAVSRHDHAYFLLGQRGAATFARIPSHGKGERKNEASTDLYDLLTLSIDMAHKANNISIVLIQ